MSVNEEITEPAPKVARVRKTRTPRAKKTRTPRVNKVATKLPEGVEQAGDQDTSQRAYFGMSEGGYPASKREPGFVYLRVTELPESYEMDQSMFDYVEGNGYTFVEWIGTRKKQAWYKLPREVHEQRKKNQQQIREKEKARARQMANKSYGDEAKSWITQDNYGRKRGVLGPEPIVFNT